MSLARESNATLSRLNKLASKDAFVMHEPNSRLGRELKSVWDIPVDPQAYMSKYTIGFVNPNFSDTILPIATIAKSSQKSIRYVDHLSGLNYLRKKHSFSRWVGYWSLYIWKGTEKNDDWSHVALCCRGTVKGSDVTSQELIETFVPKSTLAPNVLFAYCWGTQMQFIQNGSSNTLQRPFSKPIRGHQ